MTNHKTRREILRGGVALAAWGVLGVPEWLLPALAQGESLVPFTDLPASINLTPTPDRRILDVRKIDGPFTPKEQFFTIQHHGHPEIEPASFRLKITGLVDRPGSFSLDELRRMRRSEVAAGFECSGNRRPLQGLCSNGLWTGTSLRTVLEAVGVKDSAREFVFFGADHGVEEVAFRTQTYELDQQFGRSLPRAQAMSDEPLLAYALNGEPLTRHQGSPLRLIVPGWYGVANVKWLSLIHVQQDQFLGKYQARWYRTVKGESIDGEMKWMETAITRLQLKSFIARVTRVRSGHRVLGVVLNDGTPLRSVEVRVDDGPWQPATLDPSTRSRYSWKLFTYEWTGATPGEHTLVSRAIDRNGTVQPTQQELENKKSFLEDNSQYPRIVMIG